MTTLVSPLEGMTQEKWARLSPWQKDAIRDWSGLTKQLTSLEGYSSRGRYHLRRDAAVYCWPVFRLEALSHPR